MGSHYTTEPSIDDLVWNFEPWDSGRDIDPPWKIRGLWYHNGRGNYVVLKWQYCLCETGCCWLISGDIYRIEDFSQALALYQTLKSDGEFERGVYLFSGREILCRNGEEFPKPLPDGRW